MAWAQCVVASIQTCPDALGSSAPQEFSERVCSGGAYMRHSETHSCSLVASTVVGYGGFSEHAKLAASSCRRIVASEGLGAHMPTQIFCARRPTTFLPAHGAQPFSRRVGWPSNPQSIRAHADANRPERLRALIQWQRVGPLFQFCRGPAGNRGHDCRCPGDELVEPSSQPRKAVWRCSCRGPEGRNLA